MLTKEKKQQLINDFEDWWDHKLERPIIQVTLKKKNTENVASRGQLLKMVYDNTCPASEVAKSYRAVYESNLYLGDAFPNFYMRSTGILGAMLGQSYHIDEERGTIWFEEMKGKELQDIRPCLDENNWLYQRGMDLIKAFQEEFKDDIAFGIPNLGGMMDIVESMRGANNSLSDLYDDPDEVTRLNDEIYNAYEFAYKNYIEQISKQKGLGYSGWISLLSQKPYFISQCDFCCMIGPAQFDEFVTDTLKKEVNLIERSFYHLDGPGAVRHLDRIIECGFAGIQWINGAGSKPIDDKQWSEIYHKVHDAGLLLQINCYNKDELRFIDHIVNLLQTTKGLAFICEGNEEDREEFEKVLNKYGVPR